MGRDATLAEWRAAAATGTAPDSTLHKQYVADALKVDVDRRLVSFTISTGAVDRARDTVKVDGWDLERYRQNPVVLWAHDASGLPVARAEYVNVEGSALKARVVFAERDQYAFADTVYQLLKGGFLKAASVGFKPLEWVFNEERGGVDFLKQELLEFSIVPIPANPEALVDAKAAGIDLADLRTWAERTLDGVAGPGLWVPRQDVEAVYKLAAASASSVATPPTPAPPPPVVERAGRVLSTANEERLRRALTAGHGLCDEIEAVLSQVTGDDEDDDEEMSAPPATTKAVLLAPEPRFEVPTSVVRAAVKAAVHEAVAARVRRATGRLD